MKQILLATVLLLSVNSYSQKDFDYTVYTMNQDIIKKDTTQNLNGLSIHRRIEKVADVLKIINIGNTADVTEYKLEYLGYAMKPFNTFTYVDRIKKVEIFINPVTPLIKIQSKDGSVLFY